VPLCLYESAKDDALILGLIDGDEVIDVGATGGPATLASALRLTAASLTAALDRARTEGERQPVKAVTLTAPIDEQEIWAAGVTYLRSRDARMEESQEKSVYDRVYDAERPEIFFKAMRSRVSGSGQEVAIRSDSSWDVPEPEFTLVINTSGEIVGYTIGNDVSSRTIEGENPLYLPQAKVYAKCAGLGSTIALASEIGDTSDLAINLTIRRGGEVFFEGESSTSQIHRTFEVLVRYLRSNNEFPAGVLLMTGTGIVPPTEFTLEHGDHVTITIAGIGTLENPVIRLG
jgi:2-dehydro-3-deoxy-D-arabinonate dehydratase